MARSDSSRERSSQTYRTVKGGAEVASSVADSRRRSAAFRSRARTAREPPAVSTTSP